MSFIGFLLKTKYYKAKDINKAHSVNLSTAFVTAELVCVLGLSPTGLIAAGGDDI